MLIQIMINVQQTLTIEFNPYRLSFYYRRKLSWKNRYTYIWTRRDRKLCSMPVDDVNFKESLINVQCFIVYSPEVC
jgi:hypothetical protein